MEGRKSPRQEPQELRVYGYLKGSLPKDDGMIPASGVLKPQRIRGGGHSVVVKIPANSLVVLSQRQVK